MNLCVCGHLKHHNQKCACGCTIYEFDDGTDGNPHSTEGCYRSSAFGYSGRYGKKYTP